MYTLIQFEVLLLNLLIIQILHTVNKKMLYSIYNEYSAEYMDIPMKSIQPLLFFFCLFFLKVIKESISIDYKFVQFYF